MPRAPKHQITNPYLEDMTFRAIRILKEADLILAEDTRTSAHLLRHYEITTRTVSHHKFNEHKTVERIADQIASGDTVALISDAGTPSISDPGFLLVRTCLGKGVEVECLPGATAFVPALVNSGFPSDRFCFEGFLPQKKGREKKLRELEGETRTMIFYESPFRLIKLLEQMTAHFGGERRVSVSRELTKHFEENFRGTCQEVMQHFSAKTIKGELVVVVEGKTAGLHPEEEEDSTDSEA
ncbi:MAG: 16S rRNA (cytidine(1402)-2'-O)-methyltransferase [Marinilabiliales bacterium]|nr:16S rRNA (cytidine(1402)-2'-O)-methyltransferase [Marinilabiliales bacterium]